MSRIEVLLKEKKGYIAYLMAGDGGLDCSLEAMKAFVAGGVNIIEVGVPFSDPVADGPVIAAAASRAVALNVTLLDVLELVKQFRQESDVPIILFTYYNPLLKIEKKDIYAKIKAAGIDACLVVDLPLAMSMHYQQQCLLHQLDPIFVVTPNTPFSRLKLISKASRGMLYYACRKGVTGIQASLPTGFTKNLREFKQQTSLPMVAGFGIADRESAALALQVADGVVVGSRFVKAIADGINKAELIELVASIAPSQSRHPAT